MLLLLSRVTWRMLIATARKLREYWDWLDPGLESTRLIVTSFLGNCSSCTGIYYLGNPLNCMSSTERAAHSWRECRDEKDPLCENWERRNWREKNCHGNVTLKREQRISLPSDALWVYLIGVYVIRLHAVQFGNNWKKKIPRTAKICNFYPLVIRRASPSFSYDSPVRNIREFPPRSLIRGR